MPSSLRLVYDAVSSKSREDLEYWIPRLWISSDNMLIFEETDTRFKVEPYSFFKAQIRLILENTDYDNFHDSCLSRVCGLKLSEDNVIDKGNPRLPGDWMAKSTLYGLFMRSFTAYDHDQDGVLGGADSDISLNTQGFRETGTFLKAIALLPYIKSLGFDCIYLLPVSMNGQAHHKGELGSPYSQKNPFKLDPIYHDPLINEITLEMQFKAFVEAAHALGMRVILDSVPRIGARDSDFIPEHPDWFYWIKKSAAADYHSPEFSKSELKEIHARIKSKNKETIPPHKEYLDLFVPSPEQRSIKYEPGIGYVGKSQGSDCVVPGAFSDWPPDDIQPPWTDVSYFRLYKEPEFDYVAYNTVRMYDSRIQERNQALWDTIAQVIPYYQEEFGIDGARIDMGHALPAELETMIIESARRIDPDFGFMCENFNPYAEARPAGYNIVMGNAWYMLSRYSLANSQGKSMAKTFLKDLANIPNPILGSPETADSPRAASRKGGIVYTKASWSLSTTLPNFVPFCVAGYELGDKHPSNLGLDFNSEEIAAYEGKSLAFFDRAALDWESPFSREISEHIRRINSFRNDSLGMLVHVDNFQWIENEVESKDSLSPSNPVISYFRSMEASRLSLRSSAIFGQMLLPIEVENDYLFVINLDCENEVITTLFMDQDMELNNIYNEECYRTVNHELNLRLKPGETIIALRE